jgi:hypothetical protein
MTVEIWTDSRGSCDEMIDLGISLASETVGLIIGYSRFPSIAMKQVRREVELHFEKSEPTKSRGEQDIATEQSPSYVFLSPLLPSRYCCEALYQDFCI